MTIVFVGVFLSNVFPYICCLILILIVLNKISLLFVNRFRRNDNRFSKKLVDFTIKPSENVSDDVAHINLNFQRISDDKQLKISRDYLNLMKQYRCVKSFSSKKISAEVLENVIKTAGTSPSGVHTEPWTFAVVSNENLKKEIRILIEHEELKHSKKITATSPLLELAPSLIIVFKQVYGIDEYGDRKTHYQNQVTVAMATGVLIAALHNVGLATVPCSPLNTGPAIRKLLNRPINEKALFLLPVGYPNELQPFSHRKNLDEIMSVFV